MNFYYNNKARDKREPLDEIMKKEIQKNKKLCVHQGDKISITSVSEMRKKEMSDSELRDYMQKSIEELICLERQLREREIIAVKVGKRFQSDVHTRMIEEDLADAAKVADFFIRRGYSILDVLIRCSTEATIINATGFVGDDLIFSLTRYSLLWVVMEKAGLLGSKNKVTG